MTISKNRDDFTELSVARDTHRHTPIKVDTENGWKNLGDLITFA